ncbi:addiction module toxin RelE [Candidatus Pacearchaeota archaeon]|jgi:mRNA-degrading endonuclease RelE of RelBE toxin-antitoxin system|nr:addiction module toxin RelE [Candidatus Pacearchaeota archaeon]|tara:strand:+ start:20586 stop:20855 length:270 start_codon:yes stop_codon:yes gene_type:complete
MYQYKIQPTLQKILLKLHKKDKQPRERVIKKIKEVSESGNIEHYKNLKYPLQHLKRVQIGEKVLVFKFDKKNKLISFENFKHHDKIYLK